MNEKRYDYITKRIALLTHKKAFLVNNGSFDSEFKIALCNAELANLFDEEEIVKRDLTAKRHAGPITKHEFVVFVSLAIPLLLWALLQWIENPFYDYLVDQGWVLVLSPLIVFGFVMFGAVYALSGRISEKPMRIRYAIPFFILSGFS